MNSILNRPFSSILVFSALLVTGVMCGDPPAYPVDDLVSEKLAPSAEHRLGQFVLSWQAGEEPRLTVSHSDEPTRVLWQSVPGRSFLVGAVGKESVHEARGSFFVEDELQIRCPAQSLTSVAASATAVEAYCPRLTQSWAHRPSSAAIGSASCAAR